MLCDINTNNQKSRRSGTCPWPLHDMCLAGEHKNGANRAAKGESDITTNQKEKMWAGAEAGRVVEALPGVDVLQ